MIATLKDMLPRIDSWPAEDQEALVEAAREIEAERIGAYRASEGELAAIDRGLRKRARATSPVQKRLRRYGRDFASNDCPMDQGRSFGPQIDRSLPKPALAESRAAFEARLTEIERRIMEFPASAPIVVQRPGVRVVAFLDFPYRLFYRIESDVIDVLAIRHTSRRPLLNEGRRRRERQAAARTARFIASGRVMERNKAAG